MWRSLAAALYWAPGEREKAADAYRQAATLAEQERRLDPKDARVLAQLADCYAMLGDTPKARPLAAEAGALAPQDRRVASTLAGVYEHVGDRDAALRWLGVAFALGYPRNDVDSDPTFEKLRKDPRWRRLARPRPQGHDRRSRHGRFTRRAADRRPICRKGQVGLTGPRRPGQMRIAGKSGRASTPEFRLQPVELPGSSFTSRRASSPTVRARP